MHKNLNTHPSRIKVNIAMKSTYDSLQFSKILPIGDYPMKIKSLKTSSFKLRVEVLHFRQ